MEVGTMAEFKKHDFGFFSSKEELQDTLNRKKASIAFEAVKDDVTTDEFLRANLKTFLIEAVSLGINPTLLTKNRLELLFYDMDMFFDLIRNGESEGYKMEEVFEIWKEETEELKNLTEEELYDLFSKKHD